MAFEKGYIPWNKDKKTGVVPKTAFEKGHTRTKKGKLHHNYKGGWISDKGYRVGYYKGKRMFEHKYVWLRDSEWNFIPKGFIVHHIDGNKLNNVIDNLISIPKEVHDDMHYGRGIQCQ